MNTTTRIILAVLILALSATACIPDGTYDNTSCASQKNNPNPIVKKACSGSLEDPKTAGPTQPKHVCGALIILFLAITPATRRKSS